MDGGIEVVETDTVPRTRIAGHASAPRGRGRRNGAYRPADRRDAEEYGAHQLLRNPRSGFTAYVPRGSVARGAALATTGGGKTTACSVCHGERLDGLALVPTLRGRSPSYIARQLADFKQGTRHGAWAPLMTGVVAKLDADDILNVAAYLASLPPEAGAAQR